MEQTGDIFNDLYVLSKKIEFIKPKQDKTTIDYEFEKNKEECTFKPETKSINASKRNQKIN